MTTSSSLLFSIFIASASLLTQVAQATHYKLFVLTGQSNSLGVTNGGEPDPTVGSDAADSKIIFAWHNVASSSNSLGHSGQTLPAATSTANFTTLKDQQGGFYTNSATHWGPEVEFARTLYRAGVKNFGVIKASRGGGGNGHWVKGGGHMYSQVTSTVAEAVASLPNGDTYEIAGLLYLQGESDNAGEAAIADIRFKALVDNLRMPAANGGLDNAANMHAVIGGIAAPGGNRDTVRSKHASIAASTSYIDYFENIDQQTKLHDGLHFNRAAKIIVGNRYAQKFLEAGIVSRIYGKLVFIGDSITQGGNGDHPSYRYQVFKNLANQGVPINASTGYKFVGSVNGPYKSSPLTTPNVNGQVFENNHDGHFGWRAFWENARIDLPGGRYNTNNLGQGTIENWTGQTTTFDTADNGTLTYTATTYTPDTAVIMIGINDMAGGTSATQTRNDIGVMIDQLQAANANISIFLSQTLHTNQNNASLDAKVDTLNSLLPALATSKTTSTSSVWVIETDAGFNPVTQTYDKLHPNTSGEIYIGDRISGGLGIISMPAPATATSPPPVIEKGTSNLKSCFEGNEIYNGANFINGWTEVSATTTTETLSGTDLNRHHINGSGAWLEGTTSSDDGGSTTWDTSNHTSWTYEARLRFNANPNGFRLWTGTDTNLLLVDIYGDRTRNDANTFNKAHNNLDGQYHTWRIAHDLDNSKYHVWRDGERLTPNDGVAYDSGSNDSRLIMGDSTGGSFADNYNVDIDYVCYDQTGAYLPTGADADSDGMTDSWEYLYFGDIASASPDGDNDDDGRSNLEEYIADTNPTDSNSRLRISSTKETTSNHFSITIPDTSPQRNYTLYESNDLGLTDPWTAVPGQGPTIGTDGDLIFSHSSSAKKFYRVEVSLP